MLISAAWLVVLGGCEARPLTPEEERTERLAGQHPTPSQPAAPAVAQPPAGATSEAAPTQSLQVTTVMTGAGRTLISLSGTPPPPGTFLTIARADGAPVGVAMMIADEPGQPPLALLVGLSRAYHPVIPGDRLSLRQPAAPEPEPEPVVATHPTPDQPPAKAPEPESQPPAPAQPQPAAAPAELPPPGSLADLERVARPPTLNASQSSELSRLESERRWLELSARVLRLPPGSAELTDLQERLRRELTEHLPAGDQP